MNLREAARILSETYANAPDGEKVVRIHLFGIQYAEELQGLSMPELLALSELPASYGTEIKKGMKLAAFVQLRP